MPVRSFQFKIAPSDKGKKVPVRTVVEKLDRLQMALVHLGEYLTGSEFRARGRAPESVRKRCALVISDVRIGSLETTLELEDPQIALGGPTLGEDAIEKLLELARSVEEDEDVGSRLNETLKHPLHRSRVLQDLKNVWPEIDEHIELELHPRDGPSSKLTPRGRFVLEGLVSMMKAPEEASVKGVLWMLAVEPGPPVLRLDGPDGRIKCAYSKDVEEMAKRLIGKPAAVFGEAEFDAAGNVREIVRVTKIERFQEITLQRLFRADREIVLREPLTIFVDFVEGMWTMENEDLGIIASGDTYEDCLAEFQDEFFFIWKEYAQEDDERLSKDAKSLKTKLSAIVQSGPP